MGIYYDKRTRRYTVRIFRNGAYRVRERLPAGTTKQQAQAYETKCRQEIFDADRLGIKPDRLIEEAVLKWVKEESGKSKNPYGVLNHLEMMSASFRGRRLSELSLVAEEYIRSSHGVLAPSTVNRRIAILRRIANLAYRQWEWIDQPIAQRIRLLPVNNARQVYLTREEVLKIVRCCERRETRALVLVLAWTGLRLGEAISLDHSAISDRISVKDSKNGQPRVVPVVGYARWAIRDFPLKLHHRTLTRDWEQARVKAGYPHVHIHDLRHSCASRLLWAGVSLEVVGQILGHKSLQTTRRYAHLSIEAAHEALRKIA